MLELIGERKSSPRGIDGISFAPTLLGKRQKERTFLYRESPGYGGQQSVRVGDWKAIRTNLNPAPRATNQEPRDIELYNLATDAGESRNVASENPKVVARLEKLMREQHVPSEYWLMWALDGKERK